MTPVLKYTSETLIYYITKINAKLRFNWMQYNLMLCSVKPIHPLHL